jgi:hypothetical protein
MKNPRHTTDAGPKPAEGSRDSEGLASLKEFFRRDALIRAKNEVRRGQAAEVKRWFYAPMDKRGHFKVFEVANAVVRSVAATRHQVPLTSVKWERERAAVIRQIADAIREGCFDNLGGVVHPRHDEPLKPLQSEYFRVVAAEYSDPTDRQFLADYIEPTCITREGAASFLQKHSYPWPANWGACPPAESAIRIEPPPVKQAAAIEAAVKEVQAATDSDTRKAALTRRVDFEKAYKERIGEGRYPTMREDEAWAKDIGISRPRLRELRAKIRPPYEKKGGHPKGRRKT